MKKFLMVVIVIAFLVPFSVFAQGPSPLEVETTTSAVLSTFGMIFLSSMFGEAPEGVEVDMDMTTGKSSMTFENFNAAEYFRLFGEMSSETIEELPEFYFDSMSGSISVDENGDMSMDMKLKGGNIDTLKMQTKDEDLVYFTANGKDFSYIEDIMSLE